MSDFIIYNLLLKSKSFFWGKLPKYIMQYLDTAWKNKYIFTFSGKLEIKIKVKKLEGYYEYLALY